METAALESPPLKMIGNDRLLSVNDVTAFQRHLAEFEPFNDKQLAAADTNGDGKVSIEDATQLQKYLAEYPDIVLGKQ